MTSFTKILTSAKIGNFYGKLRLPPRQLKGFFDISDKGHSRVQSISQFFSPSGCIFAVGCHALQDNISVNIRPSQREIERKEK